VPSLFTHAAPALALVPLFRTPASPARLWALGVACAAAPDLDVLAFRFGIPYEHPLGHRGLSHSLPFAAGLAALACLAAYPRRRPRPDLARAWLYLFLATASHGLLDMLTNGGQGVALWSPFENGRHFFAFRPIEASPLAPAAFFSSRGLAILAGEALWIWLPCALLAAAFVVARRPAARPR
jgi:inner membrane protein